MKRSRFSEEQIIGILKEEEGSESIREVCARHNLRSRPSSDGAASWAIDCFYVGKLKGVDKVW